MMRRLIWVLMLLMWTLPGCALDIFHDAISTEIEVPRPDDDTIYVVDKRFRFERNITEAEGAIIDRAWVQVDHEDIDLSSISRVQVYVVDPATEEEHLLVSGGDFRPGDTLRDLTIEFEGDVRGFIDDNRVKLVWYLEPNRLFKQWQAGEIAAFGFGLVLEIDTP